MRNFKKKFSVLIILILGLSALFIVSIFFNQDNPGQRDSAYTWLDPQFISSVDRIEISGFYGNTLLLKKNNKWVIPEGGMDFPVRQIRAEDLLKSLSLRKNYPIRSKSGAAKEKLGLGTGASRIILKGGAGLPLLDLLVGSADVLGKEVYLRRTAQNEIRSGEDIFSVFIDSDKSFWYDLRLFPETVPSMVQRIHIYPPGLGEAPLFLGRRGSSWINENSGIDVPGTEAWLRSLLDIQGETFVFADDFDAEGSIILELGDASFRTLFVGPQDSQGRRMAMVTGSALVYSLSEGTINRIFRSF